MNLRARERNRDRGVTLVELVIAITLLGVVGGAITGALYLGVKTTNNSSTRLDQSMTEMAVTRYLTGDILSAEGPVTVNGSDNTCGSASLKLYSRSDATKATKDTVVAWALVGTDLVRRTCTGGTQTSEHVIAKGVSAFTPGACAVSCTSNKISVTFTAAAAHEVSAASWTLTVTRRGVTS